jgi:hypothetical protein
MTCIALRRAIDEAKDRHVHPLEHREGLADICE